MQLVRQTGKKNPSIVTEMKQSDFFQISDLYNSTLQNKKVKEDGEKVAWRNTKVVPLHKKDRKSSLPGDTGSGFVVQDNKLSP
ncbi:unnamed protein product [Diabrotica balteata]|uniref:Uncharacterized protein n=1 Tax=Diabrotica balteata TaxID=107213 RepID=A0A9N9T476_DIABA|nr:unnamed protein product [Diabrotica balteata]